jgi:hypothetical protein
VYGLFKAQARLIQQDKLEEGLKRKELRSTKSGELDFIRSINVFYLFKCFINRYIYKKLYRWKNSC